MLRSLTFPLKLRDAIPIIKALQSLSELYQAGFSDLGVKLGKSGMKIGNTNPLYDQKYTNTPRYH